MQPMCLCLIWFLLLCFLHPEQSEKWMKLSNNNRVKLFLINLLTFSLSFSSFFLFSPLLLFTHFYLLHTLYTWGFGGDKSCLLPSLLSLPVFTGSPSNEQTKARGGKKVACKRIRDVSCGCALSHTSLVAHRDYESVGLPVLCGSFKVTSSWTSLTCVLFPRAHFLLLVKKKERKERHMGQSSLWDWSDVILLFLNSQFSLYSHLPVACSHDFCDLFLKGKNPEDVVRRYTEKIKVVPDEVRIKPIGAHIQDLSCFMSTVMYMSNGSSTILARYSRTVPSAWRGWSCHPAMKASCSTKASSQSWWANLASVGTCTICYAWWPCTTMAIRWVKACEPDAVMMSR